MGKRFLSLKTKFIVLSTLLVTISSIAWGSWFWHRESRNISKKIETEGRLLLTSIQAPIIDAIVYERIGVVEQDAGLLDNFIEQIINNQQLHVLYTFITDNDGKAVAHSHFHEFGHVYRDPLTVAVLSGHGFISRTIVDKRDGKRVFDMGIPLRVSGKSWGTLRVGLSMEAFDAELGRLKQEILIFSGLFFLAGNLIFYIVGLTMSRPLQELSEAMVGVNYESLDTPFTLSQRSDELGQLQESFNEMRSRLKNAELERQRAVARLVENEKLATIGKIVAGVAHEINNPLMVMSTSMFHLERKASQELGRYVTTHKEGMQRIEAIVRQLSDFSRVGNLESRHVPSDQFFRETAAFAGMALKKHEVRFRSSDEVPATTLTIDKGKLHQVVLNLLLNAANASPPGGSIDLTARREGDDYILSVRDEGGGIAPEHREKIFEIFYTTKPGGEGSGIGLAISKSIVEMHRGEITFESRPGETVFTVRIPLKQGAEDG